MELEFEAPFGDNEIIIGDERGLVNGAEWIAKMHKYLPQKNDVVLRNKF